MILVYQEEIIEISAYRPRRIHERKYIEFLPLREWREDIRQHRQLYSGRKIEFNFDPFFLCIYGLDPVDIIIYFTCHLCHISRKLSYLVSANCKTCYPIQVSLQLGDRSFAVLALCVPSDALCDFFKRPDAEQKDVENDERHQQYQIDHRIPGPFLGLLSYTAHYSGEIVCHAYYDSAVIDHCKE